MVRRRPSSKGRAKFIAFSYVDGRRLGKFSTLTSVFKRFPRERTAFKQVKRFSKNTGRRVTTLRQIKSFERKIKRRR